MRRHTYEAAERFILSREFFGMKLGLENITHFLESISSPQDSYESIHIAGTNGKGSVAVLLAAVLRAAGYRTGLFTSPHLMSFRERITVDGRRIPASSVTAFIDRFRPELVKRKLSFFEVITALALYYFDRAGVEVAVIEVGLGGRLDATNVLSPRLTVTTDISYDHMEILGTTLSRIAREKAGIIKQAVPHLVGHLPESAERVIRNRCEHLNAPFYRLHEKEYRADSTLSRLDFVSNGFSLTGFRTGLYGPHQVRNAALAVKAITILKQDGFRIGKTDLRRGLAQASWPGRFQIITRRNQPILVLDVCHNVAGMRAFVETFRIRFPNREAYVITGFVKRKEHQKMFNLLSKIAASYAIVPLKTKRSTDLEELFATIDWRGIEAKRFGSLGSAWRRVSRSCQRDDLIVIIGSHFLVGEFLKRSESGRSRRTAKSR